MALFRAHVAAGFAPSEFWGLSPRLYVNQMRAHAEGRAAQAQARAWLAWHAGALSRPDIKLPDARKFIGAHGSPASPVRRRQTRDQLDAMCNALAAAWGAKG